MKAKFLFWFFATSCSVKARGGFLLPTQLEVTICDFKYDQPTFYLMYNLYFFYFENKLLHGEMRK